MSEARFDAIDAMKMAMYVSGESVEQYKKHYEKETRVNNGDSEKLDFRKLFDIQGENQREMLRHGMYDGVSVDTELPIDSINLTSYHVQQLMSEIGELLDADKRWKNFRNEKYEREAKLDELADCFIELMNISMFSGFDAKDIYNAIYKKLDTIKLRIDEEKKKHACNCSCGKEKYKPEGVCNCSRGGEKYDISDEMSILDFIFYCCKN